MLAQNFKTATDLSITDIELEALIKVLKMFERQEILPKQFLMGNFFNECGTAACICGWAHKVDARAFPEVRAERYMSGVRLSKRLSKAALRLFAIGEFISEPTPAEAAIALRNFLTEGEPRWGDILGDEPE